MAEKKKCRQYSIEYLKFGFIPSPSNEQLPLCLICNAVFSNEAMKPSRLKEHLNKKHMDKVGKDINYFQKLKQQHSKHTCISLLRPQPLQQDKGLIASYNVSLLIAQNGKPHDIGEKLILPAIKEVVSTVMNADKNVVGLIPLSNSSVSRRIDEMAANVEEQLCTALQKTEFSIQLDESTIRDGEALLLAYVRYLAPDDSLSEDLLFARSLVTDTKGSSIFHVVQQYFNEKGM